MTIQEMYNEAKKEDFKSLIFLIEWLVFEREVVTMDRDAKNIDYIVEKYRGQLNPYLAEYKARTEGMESGPQFSEPKIDGLSAQ